MTKMNYYFYRYPTDGLFCMLTIDGLTGAPQIDKASKLFLTPCEIVWLGKGLGIPYVSERTLNRQHKNPDAYPYLPAFEKVGRNYLYDVNEVNEWLKEWHRRNPDSMEKLAREFIRRGN